MLVLVAGILVLLGRDKISFGFVLRNAILRHNILFNTLINLLLFNFSLKKGRIQYERRGIKIGELKIKRSLFSIMHLRKTIT